jgi:putative ABC transport system permease protein
MNGLAQDIRYTLRTLSQSPVFTFAALLCLALGIGANTAIFSVVHSVVFQPLPFGEPDRLVIVRESLPSGPNIYLSPADYLDIREWSETLEDVTGHRWFNCNLTGYGEPVRIPAETVSPSFFQVFDIQPVLGRWFLREDDPDSAGVRSVVLSYTSWQNRFGGDTGLVGRSLILNGEPHTVVGIAPPSFTFPEKPEMWVRAYRDDVPEPPINLRRDLGAERTIGFFKVVARLAPGVDLERANSEMTLIAKRLDELEEEEREPIGLSLQPLHEFVVGDIRTALLVLLGSVGLVLLIACANVANLLLARATSREREIAVRSVLGASRSRLVRQHLTENVLLGVVGGFFGLLLALWGIDVLVRLAPGDLPRLTEIGMDRWVLLFTLGVSFITGVLFGLIPAYQTTKPNLQSSLKEGGRTATLGGKNGAYRGLLIVAEVALSIVLLCGAGLLIKSLVLLQTEEPGFEPGNVLSMYIVLSEAQYPDGERQNQFFKQVVERVDALPGVASVGGIYALPFTGSAAMNSFGIEGRPTTPAKPYNVVYQTVTPGFLQTMGTPLLAGRNLTWQDDENGRQVLVINETLAQRYWPDEDPVGKRVSLGGDDSYWEIVGVVGDVRHFGYESAPDPQMYISYLQLPTPRMAMVVRARGGDPTVLAGSVREQVYAVDPNQPVFAVRTLDEVLRGSTRQRRFTVELLGLFAIVAILLAMVGIYGVMSYSVSQRVHEIGVRMALGARRSEVLRLTIAKGLKWVLAGTALGVIAALGMTRFVSSLLYGISATDPEVFIGVAVLLIATATFAAYLPASRASRVDPVVALRHE